ncbi:TolB family protein [Myxococcus sp. 1LA]
MASSLLLAACGGAEAESLADAESQAVASQSLVEPTGESADRRIIVYQTTSLQLMRVDNQGRSQLVAQRTGAPEVSPNGNRVAYAKLPDGYREGDAVHSAELYVLNANSGKSTQVTQGFDDSEPIWTPDGRIVLFQSTRRTGVPSLWRVKENGKDLKQLTNVGDSRLSAATIPNPAQGGTVEWDADRRIMSTRRRACGRARTARCASSPSTGTTTWPRPTVWARASRRRGRSAARSSTRGTKVAGSSPSKRACPDSMKHGPARASLSAGPQPSSSTPRRRPSMRRSSRAD